MVESVDELSAERLRAWDIRGIATDLDNTIVPWYTTTLAPGVAAWAAMVRALGIRMCLVTNNYGSHATDVARELGVPIVRGALKPLPGAFTRCLRVLETDAAHTLAIGDQLFTDVLGAKLVGMRAVYVQRVAGREFPTTKVLRMLESPVLACLRRSGVPPQ
ncbi:MAG: YqeG family HAD IIIA-type phosphatase [Candidatus Eremiobacteraeota bacterium]|nr:YqeG family HAD IIIA-type phosphatase [Candidatus Eremiobacteraeota bacterium]